MLSLVCELQSFQEVLYFQVIVGTDHAEGIPRLIGKICFLEETQDEVLVKEFKLWGNKIHFRCGIILICVLKK